MRSLTMLEARSRAGLLTVDGYELDVDLTGGPDTFRSTTTVRFRATPGADTFIELRPHTLRAARLNGRQLDPATLAEGRLPLPGLAADNELVVEADYPYSRSSEGMHRFVDPADGKVYIYAQPSITQAPRFMACFDQPDLKAPVTLRVTADPQWLVRANGAGRQVAPGRWEFAPTPPLATYLITLAAGPYHELRAEHDGIPLGLYARASLAGHLEREAPELFEVTAAGLDYYHDRFGIRYPFGDYDQVFAPEFSWGAMEFPGCVLIRDELVFRSAVTDSERERRAVLIAHEMAHMWFGDLVTLKWWDDIWLNESFAEYMGYQTVAEATRFTDTWTDFGVARKAWGYDADQRPSTHPVAPESVGDTASALLNFDGISYAKGASALRQLVAWLGEKDFLAGINTHFARHRFANATLADFLDSLASATDRDVHAWADAWLRTTGVDTLTASVDAVPGRWTLTLDRDGSRPHRVTVGVYDRDLGDGRTLVLRERYETDVPHAAAPEPRPGTRPALVVPNDLDLTYAKIRLDETSLETALRGLSGIPDALTRAVVWNSLRDMVRDGDLAPFDYLATAGAHLPEETDLALVQGVLAFAGHIADRYLEPKERPAALSALTSLCRDVIRRTEDGDHPGLRLIAVRHFISAAAHPDTIAAWLAEGTVPGGPELDPELRWRILARLAVLGAVDEDAIAAELERDPSATGQEGAARCRAALPDAEAKRAAWEAMFATDERTDLSNYLFTATAQGFWQPEQAELLRDYVPRFYRDAVALAARRGPAIAEAAGRWAFPVHAVDAEHLRLGRACLRDADPVPALRRKLVDQLDDLARALRIREA